MNSDGTVPAYNGTDDHNGTDGDDTHTDGDDTHTDGDDTHKDGDETHHHHKDGDDTHTHTDGDDTHTDGDDTHKDGDDTHTHTDGDDDHKDHDEGAQMIDVAMAFAEAMDHAENDTLNFTQLKDAGHKYIKDHGLNVSDEEFDNGAH